MAITRVATGDKYAVGTAEESVRNHFRIYPAGTHDFYGNQVRGHLQPACTGKVGPRIRAPVT